MALNTFELRPDSSGGFDAFIDGGFLRSMVYEGVGDGSCPLTLMRRGLDLDIALGQISQLKAEVPGDFGDDRVWLYFCPLCFDPGCGGASVRVGISANVVVWSGFTFDPDPDPDEDYGDEPDPLEDIGPFTFDRFGYEKALDDLGAYLRGPYSELNSPSALSKPVALGIGAGRSRRSIRLQDPQEGLQWTVGGLPLIRILHKTLGRTLPRRERTKLSTLVHSPVQGKLAPSGPAGRQVLDMLLGQRVFADLPGRVPLFVGERLDLEHGAITARVTRLDDTVIWDEFQAFEAGFAEPFHVFPRGISCTFDLAQHDESVHQALDAL